PNLPADAAPSTVLAALATSPAPGIGVALKAVVRLGCRARAVGSHGADLLGHLARAALREAGIDTELVRPTGSSPCDLTTVADDGTLRTHYAGEPGDSIPFDPAAAVRDAAALLIDGSL